MALIAESKGIVFKVFDLFSDQQSKDSNIIGCGQKPLAKLQ